MKRKSVVPDPLQLEKAARLSDADFRSCFSPDSAAVDILRQFDQVAKQTLERNQILDEVDPVRMVAKSIRTAAGRGTSDAPGECPPLTNRGGKFQPDPIHLNPVKLVLENGEIKEVLRRRGYGGNSAMIDWISFTFGEETFQKGDTEIVTDDQVAMAVSNRLQAIFGFGITSKRNNGVNFYRDSYVIGDGWGFVGHGGQRGTVLVMLSGKGCVAAAYGWEIRLKATLEVLERAKITRVDLSHDDYEGARYSVDQADKDHTDGLFNCGGRTPDCEYRGNWKNPNGKGRTFNVGNRKNGKFARIYEKGREQGDKNSDWVRIEVEFKSVDRLIPFDVLTEPGAYLSEAYPAFNWIDTVQHRITTNQKSAQAGVDKALAWLKHQCGSHIHHFKLLLGVDELIKRVSRDDKMPEWFKVPHHSFAGRSIHEEKREIPRVDLHAAASAW